MDASLSVQVFLWFGLIDLKELKGKIVFWWWSLSTSKLLSVLSLIMFSLALQFLLLLSGGAWLTDETDNGSEEPKTNNVSQANDYSYIPNLHNPSNYLSLIWEITILSHIV